MAQYTLTLWLEIPILLILYSLFFILYSLFFKPVAIKKSNNSTIGTYKLGQRVRHAKFGDGVVLQVDGDGAQERVQINFAQAGMKWLMLSYAKLERL